MDRSPHIRGEASQGRVLSLTVGDNLCRSLDRLCSLGVWKRKRFDVSLNKRVRPIFERFFGQKNGLVSKRHYVDEHPPIAQI